MAEQNNKNWFVRHKVMTVILGFIAIGIIASIFGGGSKNNSNSSNTESSKSQSEAKVAKVGEAAADGKFEFTVNSLECDKANIGSDFLTKTAQGQYCLLSVAVKNIGDESQGLLSSNQYLLNDQGQKFSADDTATIYAASDPTSSWYSNINPGNSVNGVIVFDIPKDQTPAAAELHDSAFSNGVKVNLQ